MSTISKIKLMLAAVIILFVTAAVYISALVLKRQEVLEQVTRYNVAFLLSQAATEHARLEQRLSAYGTRTGGHRRRSAAALRCPGQSRQAAQPG